MSASRVRTRARRVMLKFSIHRSYFVKSEFAALAKVCPMITTWVLSRSFAPAQNTAGSALSFNGAGDQVVVSNSVSLEDATRTDKRFYRVTRLP